MDQIRIGGSDSYDDFYASLALRKIKMPKKKSIKETVPFSNITYDFSAINGEIYWEDRELEYTFEITADDPEELEERKSRFSAWVMGISKQPLYDPFIPDHHFLATYDSMDIEDDEGLDKSTLTVTFTAYPYKIANIIKQATLVLGENGKKEFSTSNDSDHPVILYVRATLNVDIKLEGRSDTVTIVGDGSEYKAMIIPVGAFKLTFTNNFTTVGTVWIGFNEEVI